MSALAYKPVLLSFGLERPSYNSIHSDYSDGGPTTPNADKKQINHIKGNQVDMKTPQTRQEMKNERPLSSGSAGPTAPIKGSSPKDQGKIRKFTKQITQKLSFDDQNSLVDVESSKRHQRPKSCQEVKNNAWSTDNSNFGFSPNKKVIFNIRINKRAPILTFLFLGVCAD